jgi:ribosome-interacting GTPase 1
VALIGFPSGIVPARATRSFGLLALSLISISVGKSTLLSRVTSTKSEIAAYEFTTLTCVPGVIEHKGANIQLLDLPGIIEVLF